MSASLAGFDPLRRPCTMLLLRAAGQMEQQELRTAVGSVQWLRQVQPAARAIRLLHTGLCTAPWELGCWLPWRQRGSAQALHTNRWERAAAAPRLSWGPGRLLHPAGAGFRRSALRHGQPPPGPRVPGKPSAEAPWRRAWQGSMVWSNRRCSMVVHECICEEKGLTSGGHMREPGSRQCPH